MNIARGTQQTYTQRGFNLVTQSQLDSIQPFFSEPYRWLDSFSLFSLLNGKSHSSYRCMENRKGTTAQYSIRGTLRCGT